MSWLLDNANFFFFVLAAMTGGFLVLGWLRRQPRYWLYAGVPLVLFALLWLLGQLLVTDQQQIRLNLEAMAKATVDGRSDLLFQHLARDFRFGNLDREELHRRVSQTIKIHKVRHIHLWGHQMKLGADRAEVIFNFRADAEGDKQFFASAKAQFVKDEGRWKMRHIEVFQLGTTNRQFIPGVQ